MLAVATHLYILLFVQQITFISVLFFYLSSKLQFYFFVLLVRKSQFLCKFARVLL